MKYRFKAVPELLWFVAVTVGGTMAANGFDPTKFSDPEALRVGFISALVRALPAAAIALWGRFNSQRSTD